MTLTQITIPGIPVAQGRPRFARRGAHMVAYDPEKSASWKNKVALFAGAAGVQMTEGVVRLSIAVYLPRPKRLCRKSDPVGEMDAPCKPDLDNLAKGIMDGLNGVAYADDRQVVALTIRKAYHAIGDAPRTVVDVVQE